IHLELLEHRSSQSSLREHALHRPFYDPLGMRLKHALRGDLAHAPEIARVPLVELVVHLSSRQLHLVCVDHNDVITDVKMRREHDLVLASQDRGDACRYSTEHLALGVHQEPLSIHRIFFRHYSCHGLPRGLRRIRLAKSVTGYSRWNGLERQLLPGRY